MIRTLLLSALTIVLLLSPYAAAQTNQRSETLFNGKNIDGWEVAEFGGEGRVFVREGCIVMEAGDPLTAINLAEEKAIPRDNYELTVEARRIEGTDFFATVTFPVGESWCSLVVGGWAGSLVGLSSIDGKDASENDTKSVMKFETGRWYRIRIRVAENKIQSWIDDKPVVDKDITGKKITIRNEMIPCRPLGIASYITTTEIRKVEMILNEP